MSKKLYFISYAYAIGAILVVLGHSTPTGASDMPLVVDKIRTFIYCFHMPLFFFIAGFLFKYTSDKKKKTYGSFIKNKCIRFLTPYFVLSAIGIIPKILLSSFVNDEVSFSFYYVFEAVFNPRLNVWGHFWFLPALLIIYSLSYLLLRCYKNKMLFSAVLAASLVLSVFPINTNWLAIKDICLELVYFCIGILSCSVILKNKARIFKLPIALASVAFSVIFYIFMSVNNFYWQEWVRNISTVVIALLMIYSVLYLSVFLEKNGSKILDYFDGKTFSIYIISWPCQAVTEMLLNRVMHMHWYITMPAMFIVGLGVPLLFLSIYKRFKHQPKFINLIFGVN
ncbi:MAG: acyltransferase family protein [Ruminococcus sp.]